MRTYPKTIKPTAQTTPLGGRFKGSNTSGEFPKKFNRGAFRPTGTTNMDYTGRRKPSKNFSGM
ncbi:hypothetical protein [Pelistega indica]|nr:hypothetical protein [Pelistega indica]